ncbi:hypothetical protein Aco04nite_04650 [Winogradskya consettensis]|uniref:Uncharacterized protein n=1 Tax=Winogradskya consettensis TaxID=113560 RepID=A0A919SAX8_9ACTN|nr:hypothetical protein Aco04nite_04650 [Actinoplanes consettensis]
MWVLRRTRFVVERTDRISGRAWLFVTGILEGDPLHVGDELTGAVIRAIEFHSGSGAGKTTIAVDTAAAIHAGDVLTLN